MTCPHTKYERLGTIDGLCVICWKQRAEMAEAACAEMRGLVGQLKKREWEWDWSDFDLEHALSSDCGKGWLSPEKAKVLREALEQAIRAYGSCMNWMDQVSRAKLSSATRGILDTDIGMCSAAIYRAKQALAATKEDK